MMIPKRAQRQYRRNLSRDTASVATARVSVISRVRDGPSGSASIVHAILTCSGPCQAAKSAAPSAWKRTSASHGRQVAPAT